MNSRGGGILDRLALEEHLIWISPIVAEKGDGADHDDRLMVLGPSDFCGQAGLLPGFLCLGGLENGRLIWSQSELKGMRVLFKRIDIKRKSLRVSAELKRLSAYVLELLGPNESNRGECRAGAGGAPGSQQGESLRVSELEDGLE